MLASPSGASWPLFLTIPQFFPSSNLFALQPPVSVISHGRSVQFCTTFAPQIRISSSTTSLRNSWDVQLFQNHLLPIQIRAERFGDTGFRGIGRGHADGSNETGVQIMQHMA